jgi:Copper amine oxidase N-terminal domain
MRHLVAALVATALLATPATAHTGTPLMRVADEAGYVYAWSASASEVTLSRPGLTVVLRPGNRRYLINERVAYASEAPVFENGELFVPADVVSQLRMLAGRNPDARATEGARTGPVSGPVTASGALTLTARQVTGREAIVVDGKAPASVPVTITLVGSISRDLPDVLLQRITLQTDGTFHATIPVAPAMPRGSSVTVTATSLPGVASASARVTIGAPNPGIDSDHFDHLPKDPLH